MADTSTLRELAMRLNMSISWTQKHWRDVAGLPAPMIGGGKGQSPRWRTADLDRFFEAPPVTAGNSAQPQPHETPLPAPVIALRTGPRDTSAEDLLRLAG